MVNRINERGVHYQQPVCIYVDARRGDTMAQGCVCKEQWIVRNRQSHCVVEQYKEMSRTR